MPVPFLSSAYPAAVHWVGYAALIAAHLRMPFIVLACGEEKSIWVFITIVEKSCIQLESKEASDKSHTTGDELDKGLIVMTFSLVLISFITADATEWSSGVQPVPSLSVLYAGSAVQAAYWSRTVPVV